VLVWALGRGIAGETAGLLAAAVFASAPSILQRSAQFMTDVPATVFLLALTLVLWRNRERATWSLLLAAPLAAGAFYSRYASILPIVLITLAAIVLWRRAFTARPAIAVGAVCLFAALLIPHIVHAVNATGRPWGLVTYTARFAGRRYVGEGLVRYLAWLPFTLAGPLAGATMLAAIVTAVARSTRRVAFLIVAALADIVLIGLAEHGDKRFIFFPVALLCVAGAIVVAEHIGAKRALAAAVTALALAGGAIYAPVRIGGTRDARIPPLLAGRIVAARAPHPCTVLAAEIAETTWYTGCSTYYFGTHAADFAVFYRGGGARLALQPVAAPQGAVESFPVFDRARQVATVFRLSRPIQ
jgi:4-amino-4-deoxy-L-arabinose transferase-like glycosyltransferase